MIRVMLNKATPKSLWFRLKNKNTVYPGTTQGLGCGSPEPLKIHV